MVRKLTQSETAGAFVFRIEHKRDNGGPIIRKQEPPPLMFRLPYDNSQFLSVSRTGRATTALITQAPAPGTLERADARKGWVEVLLTPAAKNRYDNPPTGW